MKHSSSNNIVPLDVVVVGGGFGGCYLLHLLRKNGFKTKVLEAASSIGGVWAWNRYPGARVDSEFPFYGFSDPQIWSTFSWTERFPAGSELRRYFQHVADVWDLHRDVELNTTVKGATYLEKENLWEIRTARGSVYRCKWFLAATGTSFKQHIPEWKGLDRFKGAIHHAALWPEGDTPIRGKKVAVIGAGSTGVQMLQETGKMASHVTHFIRTPNFAVPMRQRAITEDEIYANKPLLGHLFAACRNSSSGLPIVGTGKKVFDESPAERSARLEEAWKRGGFNFSHGTYKDHLSDPRANREFYDFWCKKTRQRIRDPVKRDLLAPLEPPYHIGTKRPSLEQDYFETCDRENVELTNSPIAEFTETGIVTKDGQHREFDLVAICTGYDAVTGGLRTMGIRGRNGVDLHQKWENGVVTHLGVLVNGFPNFMMIYGPQAPTSLTNGPPFIEIQCEWILKLMIQQRLKGISTIEADAEAEQGWRKHVLELADKTLLVETNSWYMGANVPGKQREFLIYLGGIQTYARKLQEALDDWKGFEVHQTDVVMPKL